MSQPDFWNDNSRAQKIINESNILRKKYDGFQNLKNQIDNLNLELELLNEENNVGILEDLRINIKKFQKDFKEFELQQLLNGKYDSNNAILEIHPGAGGTESQDWGDIMMRMYLHWANHHNFNVDIIDYQPGEVAGLKSLTMIIKGLNGYGLLHSEKGVHRFVRISPFDSSKRRHTSFVSVNVMPELDDSIDININPEDLRIDVFRSSGAGGQHINKTSSAVRIVHIPTGIVVSSQAQRSQLQNRETAMKMLKSKLYQLEMEKKQEEKLSIQGTMKDNAWGSQIRSYVFHPYVLVKDHRTGLEVMDGDSVLNGNIDPFINSYLRWKKLQLNS